MANDLIAHGVRNDAILEPITPDAVRDRYPKAIFWFEAHPIAGGMLREMGIVLVILVVLATVSFTYSSSPAG